MASIKMIMNTPMFYLVDSFPPHTLPEEFDHVFMTYSYHHPDDSIECITECVSFDEYDRMMELGRIDVIRWSHYATTSPEYIRNVQKSLTNVPTT